MWEKNDNILVAAYLIATFMSVIAAENPLFSGLRWLSHALMIITLLVLLKSSLTVRRMTIILMFLKAIIAGLLLVSWLNPPPPVVHKISVLHRGVFGDSKALGQVGAMLYRGVFGDSNALGQVAAIGAILYLHGFLTDRAKWLSICQVGMLCLALWIMWSSGSRSAMVAFLAGIALMYYLYPKFARGRTFWIGVLVTFFLIALPWLPGKIHQVVVRPHRSAYSTWEELLVTRRSVWAATWTGFQKRPLLGWGFGADDRMSKQWEIGLTSIGTVKRDAVNDTLMMLESTGVVGLAAYALLVILALRQFPTRQERHILSRIHAPPSSPRAFDFIRYHLHAVTFVVAASLLVMVQFDNTALSAGNFISATLWLCVALTGAARTKAATDEILYQRHGHRLRQPLESQSPVKWRTPGEAVNAGNAVL